FQDGKEFGIGELVWGKIKGFSWWPAIVVSHRVTAKRQAVSGMRWVQWFGDGKFSEVSLLPSPEHPSLHGAAPLLRLAMLPKHKPFPDIQPLPCCRQEEVLCWCHASSASRGCSPPVLVTLLLLAKLPLGFLLWPQCWSWGLHSAGGIWPSRAFPSQRWDLCALSQVSADKLVVTLEQCPPTKRLKTYPCNNSKEQRVEEDQTREQMVSEVTNNSGKLEDSCLSCGRRNPAIFHPLFKGGLCQTCR
ncbi:DNM3B methyltransferase, partial [Leiothrix lutea]|nr:DNM3B methyltransferase [Leiothrix lutea]